MRAALVDRHGADAMKLAELMVVGRGSLPAHMWELLSNCIAAYGMSLGVKEQEVIGALTGLGQMAVTAQHILILDADRPAPPGAGRAKKIPAGSGEKNSGGVT